MEKQQFKAESQRLLDLMINSIYTHKEIFLREIISNASDAIDKLAYTALTDDKVGINRDEFAITITRDPENRTLTVSDNGIGMSKEEMIENLGTIAKSGSLGFKQAMEKNEDIDIIGQFGVGFYSAFMVASSITVISKKYGSSALGSVSFASLSPPSLLYIFLSGAVAITAMVLPGILGSSILLIAGVYLPAIQAVRSFLHMELSVLPGLFALGFGVLAGVALSIHAIRTALHKYRSEMVWLILGLMLGSLYAIVYGAVNLTVPTASADEPCDL